MAIRFTILIYGTFFPHSARYVKTRKRGKSRAFFEVISDSLEYNDVMHRYASFNSLVVLVQWKMKNRKNKVFSATGKINNWALSTLRFFCAHSKLSNYFKSKSMFTVYYIFVVLLIWRFKNNLWTNYVGIIFFY